VQRGVTRNVQLGREVSILTRSEERVQLTTCGLNQFP